MSMIPALVATTIIWGVYILSDKSRTTTKCDEILFQTDRTVVSCNEWHLFWEHNPPFPVPYLIFLLACSHRYQYDVIIIGWVFGHHMGSHALSHTTQPRLQIRGLEINRFQ